jgi:hypothetical protein
MRQIRRGNLRKVGCSLAQQQQKTWNFFGVVQRFSGKVVVLPEGDDAPFAEKAVELEFPQIELSEMLEEIRLLVRRHQLGAVFEPLGEQFQEAELDRAHGCSIVPHAV